MPARLLLALALALAAAPAVAAVAAVAATPDRASLSYEDTVTINTACYDAIGKGGAAKETCIRDQLAALALHPAPDRTGLAPDRAREIAENCAYLRRVGVARYNDCLAKAVTAEPAPKDADDNDAAAGSAILAKALVTADPPAPAAATDVLPLPQKKLPPRPKAVVRAALPPAELYKLLQRSIFVVAAARSPGDARAREIAQGSAVAISPHLLLTNCHVVNNRPVIVLMQDTATWRAKLIAADPPADRCVLEAEGAELTPVPGVRAFDDIAVGEPVFALGAPHDLERTMTDGLVSGRRHIKGRNMIQTSAPVSPGSSGGGLFDARGNLLGITTLASLPGWQNLNFAIAAADFWE